MAPLIYPRETQYLFSAVARQGRRRFSSNQLVRVRISNRHVRGLGIDTPHPILTVSRSSLPSRLRATRRYLLSRSAHQFMSVGEFLRDRRLDGSFASTSDIRRNIRESSALPLLKQNVQLDKFASFGKARSQDWLRQYSKTSSLDIFNLLSGVIMISPLSIYVALRLGPSSASEFLAKTLYTRLLSSFRNPIKENKPYSVRT